jgi:hypothetical protein
MYDITSNNLFNVQNIIEGYDERFKIIVNKSKECKDLENKLRCLDNNDSQWKEKVQQLKSLIGEEKKKNTRFIIRYNKSYINYDNMLSLGLFRSIVTDKTKIISFSPQKSVPIEYFKKNTSSNITITELIEGTMINLYFDDKWTTTTRSNIGATNKFFMKSNKNFKDMFLEAFTSSGLEFDMFSKDYCYSFVLQHPDNRIVLNFSKPNIVLTNVYKCTNFTVEEVDIYNGPNNWISDKNINLITIPRIGNNIKIFEGHNNITDFEKSLNENNIDFSMPGIVIRDNNLGIRTKIRNPNYEYVRDLKGNQPKLQFQYYNLRRLNRVKEYLEYYPEDIEHFSKFRKQVHTWTNTLWRFYIACYIKKEKPLIEYPFEYRTHMFNLHRLYLNELRENKKYVTKNIVINFVNTLPSEHLMASINYPIKKMASKNLQEVIL